MYTVQNFENGNVLDSSQLNHIESGIIELEKDIITLYNLGDNIVQYNFLAKEVQFYYKGDFVGSLPLNMDALKGVNSLKILGIANSYCRNTMAYMFEILSALKIKNIDLAYLYIGSCTLNTHWTNAQNDNGAYQYYRWNQSGYQVLQKNSCKISEAVIEQDWDIILFQQGSNESGKVSTYSPLQKLIDYVKNLVTSDKTKYVWNMTWAWDEELSDRLTTHGYNTQENMYNQIVSCVESEILTKPDISLVIPNGTAIQNARVMDGGDHFSSDGSHLNSDGCFIAGLTAAFSLLKLLYKDSYPIDDYDINLCLPTNGHDVNNKGDDYLNPAKSEIFYNATKEALKTPLYPYNKRPIEIIWEKDAYFSSATSQYDVNRPNPTEKICKDTASGSNYTFYQSTQLFSKDELPNGYVIRIADGFKYRPEGWIDEETWNTTKPDNVNTSEIVIDEAWWGDYTLRGFNISTTNADTKLSNYTPEQMNEIFSIRSR